MSVRPSLLEYESRLNRPLMMKIPELQVNERLKHVIFARQFSKVTLQRLFDLADKIRNISQSKPGCDYLTSLLSHKRAMLYFTQQSTRTFLSFMAACQILGMRVNEIRDPSLSSEYKGEDPLDSVRMFSTYFDLIIMRSKIPNFAECCAYLMNDLDHFHMKTVPIVSGGAGADEHPTQALLDIYTIDRLFSFTASPNSPRVDWFNKLKVKYPDLTKGLDGKHYCFCGDIGRGRTVRSLCQLLALYDNITITFVCPDHPKLIPGSDLLSFLSSHRVTVNQTDTLDDVLGKTDLLYMTRIQKEHDSQNDAGSYKEEDMEKCRLNLDRVARMKDFAGILHPFPRNEEIPMDIDRDPRALYFTQARNGMWMRAALIAYLFDVDSRIDAFHQKTFSEYHDYNVGVL
ncbi:MAG: aspartate carbamoyltransferase [Thermodesulfobacteriota bacterium]